MTDLHDLIDQRDERINELCKEIEDLEERYELAIESDNLWRKKAEELEKLVAQYPASTEKINKLIRIKEFVNNEYLKDVESTIDFRGGYAAALKDLKLLLESK